MTTEDRQLLKEVHEKTIETHTKLRGMESNVKTLFKTIEGNGQPGIKDRLKAVEVAHNECSSRQRQPRQWPAIVSAICAIVAIIWGIKQNS